MTASVRSWTVYIVETEAGFLYTGITTDLKRRFQEHAGKKRGAKFFLISSPKKILFQENHPNRSEASSREAQIKKMSRLEKLALIKSSE
jgi:putative endonuclease